MAIVVSRVGLAVTTAYFPIPNEGGKKASIFHLAPSSDIGHYLHQDKLYFDIGFIAVFKVIAKVHYGMDYPIDAETRRLVAPDHLQMSPPVFPALIRIFDYRDGHTVPLAIFIIALSIVVAAAWAKWMENKGMPLYLILLFVFFPHSAWFTINLGSDFLFYSTFTLFFLICYSNLPKKNRLILSFIAVLLCVLTRPTGASLIVFFLLDQLFSAPPDKRKRYFLYLAFSLLIMSPAILFLFPYFISVVSGSNDWPFFGIIQLAYLNGIYPGLPDFLDLPLSWLSLFASKTLYMFGLRPSYGEVSILVFLMRSAPGLIFLPGFIHLMWRGNLSEKVLVLSMLAPVFAGPAQDRYLLPLQPLLFYHAWLFACLLANRLYQPLKSAISPKLGGRSK